MSDQPLWPAGYYPQPDGSQRYWDGSTWTTQLGPGQSPYGQPPHTQAPYRPPPGQQAHQQPPAPSPGPFTHHPSPPRHDRGRSAAIFGVAVVLVVLAVIAIAVGTNHNGHALHDALEHCGATDNANVSLGDEGHSLTLDGSGEASDGVSPYTEKCILDDLKVSDSVWSQMEQTRGVDARQSGSWYGYQASWTYSEDGGFDVVITTD